MRGQGGNKLADALVEAGLVDRAHAQRLLTQQQRNGGRLLRILVESGAVDEDRLIRTLCSALSLEAVTPATMKIHERVINLMPPKLALRRGALPIAIKRSNNQDYLYVALADPLDDEAIEEVQRATGCEVNPLIAPPTQLDAALERYYRPLVEGAATKAIDTIPRPPPAPAPAPAPARKASVPPVPRTTAELRTNSPGLRAPKTLSPPPLSRGRSAPQLPPPPRPQTRVAPPAEESLAHSASSDLVLASHSAAESPHTTQRAAQASLAPGDMLTRDESSPSEDIRALLRPASRSEANPPFEEDVAPAATPSALEVDEITQVPRSELSVPKPPESLPPPPRADGPKSPPGSRTPEPRPLLAEVDGEAPGVTQVSSLDYQAQVKPLEVPVELDNSPSPFDDFEQGSLRSGLERTGIIPAVILDRDDFVPPPPGETNDDGDVVHMVGFGDIPGVRPHLEQRTAKLAVPAHSRAAAPDLGSHGHEPESLGEPPFSARFPTPTDEAPGTDLGLVASWAQAVPSAPPAEPIALVVPEAPVGRPEPRVPALGPAAGQGLVSPELASGLLPQLPAAPLLAPPGTGAPYASASPFIAGLLSDDTANISLRDLAPPPEARVAFKLEPLRLEEEPTNPRIRRRAEQADADPRTRGRVLVKALLAGRSLNSSERAELLLVLARVMIAKGLLSADEVADAFDERPE